MARAMWKGVVTFGPVNVPVKLYTALRPQHVQFHLLHDQDEVRLGQQMFCSAEEVPVPREETVKGYEVAPDEYVVLADEEIAQAQPEADRSIEVMAFIEPGKLDPRYFDRPYHLGPDGDAARYAILLAALAKAKKAGVCRWVMRNRPYVGLLRPAGKVLNLVTLRTGQEVIAASELEVGQAKTNERELKTARYLVEELSGPFEPGKYHNEYEQRLKELVDKRAKGQKVELPRVRARRATREDHLMEALQASLDQVRGKKTPKRKAG